ncbi:MAG: hypothetical protein ABSF59_17890 [Candidatus Sulfotelmatobacter sp.]|jgi:hypothetical protein
MWKRIAPIGVVSFALAAGTAVCQISRQSLPDAPSAQRATQPPTLEAAVAKDGGLNPVEGTEIWRPREFIPGDSTPGKKQPDAIFRKYLGPSPSSFKPFGSHSLDGASLVVRATHAASGVIFARDESGKTRLNTSYLLRTLTSVAADTASRPYWRRSVGEPFSDFGSTVGSDAGMKVWHEFSPGLQQLMKSHVPKFISRIEERIGHR